MARCRVLQPESVRLPLSEGDFIDVKRDLNAGEYFDLITAMAERRPFSKIVAYVISWSLVGLDEKPLAYSLEIADTDRRDTLRALDKDTILELIAVIDRHEQAEDARRDAKKKATAGEIGSSAT